MLGAKLDQRTLRGHETVWHERPDAERQDEERHARTGSSEAQKWRQQRALAAEIRMQRLIT